MFLKLSIQTLWTTWAEPQILGLKLIIDLPLWPFRPPRQIVCRQSYMNPEEKTISWMHVGQAAFKEPVGTRVRYKQDMNSCVHRYTVGLFSHCHIWQSPVSWCCHVWQLINISCGGSKLGLVERSNQSKCLGGGRDWVEWVSLFWHVLYTFKGVKLYMQYLHCNPGGCPWTQGTLHIVHRPSRDHTTQQCWEPSSSHTEVRTKSAPSFNLFSFCPLSSGCFSMTWYSQNNNKNRFNVERRRGKRKQNCQTHSSLSQHPRQSSIGRMSYQCRGWWGGDWQEKVMFNTTPSNLEDLDKSFLESTAKLSRFLKTESNLENNGRTSNFSRSRLLTLSLFWDEMTDVLGGWISPPLLHFIFQRSLSIWGLPLGKIINLMQANWRFPLRPHTGPGLFKGAKLEAQAGENGHVRPAFSA